MNPTPAQPPATERGEHTPTPWQTAGGGSRIVSLIGDQLATVGYGTSEPNAAHIVHCVNTRAALEAENKKLREALDNVRDDMMDRYDGAPDSKTQWMAQHLNATDYLLANPESSHKRASVTVKDWTDLLKSRDALKRDNELAHELLAAFAAEDSQCDIEAFRRLKLRAIRVLTPAADSTGTKEGV